MGGADIVPGISGGTMAMITGIYARFIQALSSVSFGLIKAFFSGKWREVWQRIDGAFLLPTVSPRLYLTVTCRNCSGPR